MVRFEKDHKGFSLVELIVVIGIIGILAGISVTLLGHLRVANSEKVVNSISGALSKLQAQTMSKPATQTDGSGNVTVVTRYLYIYQVDGVYYLCTSTTNVTGFDASVLNKNNGLSLGSGIRIYKDDSAYAMGAGDFIRIAYKRDGSFDYRTTAGISVSNCKKITVEMNNQKTTITLIEKSGKHVIN